MCPSNSPSVPATHTNIDLPSSPLCEKCRASSALWSDVMKLAVHLFALMLLWCPSTAWAEPVSEYETKKAKTDKRKARGRSAKQEASGKTNGNGPRPKSPSPRSTGTCKLKVKPPGWRMKNDPEIESLFDRQMVIDGAFYPYYRGDLEKCCDDGDGGCLPQEDALAQTGCDAHQHELPMRRRGPRAHPLGGSTL